MNIKHIINFINTEIDEEHARERFLYRVKRIIADLKR